LQQVSEGSGTAAAIGGLGQALQRRGHQVSRLAPWRGWPATLTWRRLLFNLQLPALLPQLGYDLVVGFDIDGFLWAGRSGAPYVCSVKGVIAEELQHERGMIRQQLAMLAVLERINARRAPLVLTTSDYCRRQIGRHYGVPAQRVKLVPEGIDLAGWQARLAAGADAPPEPTILCVARQYPRKHIADLLRAMALVRGRHPTARLLIVGDGPEHSRLRALAGELELGATAQFAGALPDAEMARCYRRSRIFCLPSVQEGFGIVFLEAMAAGLPIVATTAAAISEVVPHRQAGILVPPGAVAALAAALDELLSDPRRATEYGAFGREHVRQYDWDRVAERFESVVKNTIA
jgi:glycosyltransferase involved in cell wall biosynthesis